LLTTDNVSVNVSLPEPIDGIAEGFVEVYGTALSKSTVSCKKYIIFPPELTENFGNSVM
jgi:replication factor A3